MRWSPFIQGLWIARMPADHAWRTIIGSDERKWNEINEMSEDKCWNEIYDTVKWEKYRDKPTQIPFRPPRNRDENRVVGGQLLTASATEQPININIKNNLNSRPTQVRIEGWDAIKPPLLKFCEKQVCWPTTPDAPLQGRVKWNGTKWMRRVKKWWNLW